MRSQLLVWLLAAMSSSIVNGQGAAPLGRYNVDPSQVSVSGHDSGAEMAMQLGIAYSSRIKGVGIFAPASAYDCWRDGNPHYTECDLVNTASVAGLEQTMRGWSGREIDPVEHLAQQRIYGFVGAYTAWKVRSFPKVMKLYERFVPPGNLRYEETIDVKNAFPTDYDHPLSGASVYQCNFSATSAVLSNCGFDGARATLEWIYGTLNPRGSGFAGGELLAFDQGQFATRAQGFDDLGYVYVPTSCKSGATCRLHVFLHACKQSNFTRGDLLFPRYSGHIRWAETNGIVVLFPQTYPDTVQNPDGCWDSDGTFDVQFDQKAGTQTSAIMAMVARITSGYKGGSRAIEYFHAEFGHYFVTAGEDEIAKLDDDDLSGWARTGESFAVLPVGTAGAVDMCRFFGRFGDKSSHFYALANVDCDVVTQNQDWEFEGLRFAVQPQDGAGGCAAGMQPVFRLYNNGQGGAPNHRYTTSAAIRSQMLAQGWVAEGAGDLGVVACAVAVTGISGL